MSTRPHQEPHAPGNSAPTGGEERPTAAPRQRQRMGAYTPLQSTTSTVGGQVEPSPPARVLAPRPKQPNASPSDPLTPEEPTAEVTAQTEGMAAPPKQRMSSRTSSNSPTAVRNRRLGGSEMVAPAPRSAEKTPRQRLGVPSEPTPASTSLHEGNSDATMSQEPPARSSSDRPSAVSSTAARSTGIPATKAEGTRSGWTHPVAVVLGVVLVAVALTMLARLARTLPAVQEFMATYPGHTPLPDGSSQGIPAWLGWQHFLNMFFLLLIVRTGLQVRWEKRAPGYWKPKESSFFSPKGNMPKKVSLSQWLHQFLDVLWVANGAVFIVLLAVTGHWARIVPTSWDVVPNMVSAAIQYASLNWPTENGWVHYNALQMVAYFLTVYVAAPLAVLSGVRMSTWWPARAKMLNKVYSLEVARGLHFPVMLYFVAFTLIHVFLVFFTGALRNLNHMYTSRDVLDWLGLGIFVASILVIAAAWFLTKPVFTTPLASRMGTVTKN